MQLRNGYGDKIITKQCSFEYPCVFGEELALFGYQSPFNYVAKTPVIVLAFDLVQFM